MINNMFALLRLGLDTSTIDKENISDLIMLSEEKWASICNIARKQSVLGIMLDGIDKLESSCYGLTRELKANLKLIWIGEVLQMEQRNQHQTMTMNSLADTLNQYGCHMMLMKGQANGLLYPNPFHRSPGDIDCYLFEDYARGNKIAQMIGAVDEGWYKHSVIHFLGETIENHQFFVLTREGQSSKLLQKELKEALNVDKWEFYPDSNILLPPVQWNAMFLTYHACAHFLKEGLLLKQVLDWAMFLQKEQDKVDWILFYGFCERYHFRRFIDALTAICVNKLGVQIRDSAITAESQYADKLLHSTLYDEDYVHVAGVSVWMGRWLLVKGLFKNRWKYREIYQQSIFKQLWWYFTGYLFHTEKS